MTALISPNLDFGGPVRVALNQVAVLADRGHSVVIASGARGFTQVPPAFAGAPLRVFRAVRLLPPLGFYLLVSPGLIWFLWRHAREYEQVHVHLGRDLGSTLACLVLRARRVAYVAQTHGMIEPRPSRVTRLWDAVLTGPAVGGARILLALTETERANLVRLRPSASVRLIRNGVGIDGVKVARQRSVTFLARLHPRKGAQLFTEAAREIVRRRVDCAFDIFGPDEGDAARVVQLIASVPEQHRIRYHGAARPDDVPKILASSTLYVLPAEGEPFGMTVIEALAVGTPVILHETALLAPLLVEAGAGLTFDGTRESLIEVVEKVLADAALWADMSKRARKISQTEFDISAVVRELEAIYAREE